MRQTPLLERPQLVALNKVDVPEAKDLADLVRPELEALFNHFKGSISMFYVAPATQMSFDGASPRRPCS